MMLALAGVVCRRKPPMGTNWRMDETYIEVNGEWKDLCRKPAIVVTYADIGADIELRQSNHLNDLIEQHDRAVGRFVRPRLKSKSFRCARAIVTGIKTMHMIKHGRLDFVEDQTSPAADKFDSLAL